MSTTLRGKVRKIIDEAEYTEAEVTYDRLWGLFERQSRIKSFEHAISMLQNMKRFDTSLYEKIVGLKKDLQTYKEIGKDIDGTDEGL